MKSLPPLMVELARLSKSLRLVTKTTGRFLVGGQGAQFGAQFEAVHARHVHIEKNQIEAISDNQFESEHLGPRRSTAFELGFFQRVGDGAARDGFVIHHQNVGGGDVLPVCDRVPRSEKNAEEING